MCDEAVVTLIACEAIFLIMIIACRIDKMWRKRHHVPEFIQGVDKLERTAWS